MPRPRICLYELAASGGLPDGDPRQARFAAEGQAMARALAADLAGAGCATELLVAARLRHAWPMPPGVEPILVESGCEQERLAEAAARADATIVIAPECEGLLVERFDWVEQAGGRWLGCGRDTLEIAVSKHRTTELLRRRAVPAPRGWRLKAGDAWPGECRPPAVVKPDDGAGAAGVRRLERPLGSGEMASLPPGAWRIESFVEGLSASVAVLCGPAHHVVLTPCLQQIARHGDGTMTYIGGALPLSPDRARRARQLALAAVDALPDPRGYVGVDVILGASESQDAVIEINPRMTTSYVGLRAACRENLAQAMLDVAQGREVALVFDPDPIGFRTDGTILRGATHELAGA